MAKVGPHVLFQIDALDEGVLEVPFCLQVLLDFLNLGLDFGQSVFVGDRLQPPLPSLRRNPAPCNQDGLPLENGRLDGVFGFLEQKALAIGDHFAQGLKLHLQDDPCNVAFLGRELAFRDIFVLNLQGGVVEYFFPSLAFSRLGASSAAQPSENAPDRTSLFVLFVSFLRAGILKFSDYGERERLVGDLFQVPFPGEGGLILLVISLPVFKGDRDACLEGLIGRIIGVIYRTKNLAGFSRRKAGVQFNPVVPILHLDPKVTSHGCDQVSVFAGSGDGNVALVRKRFCRRENALQQVFCSHIIQLPFSQSDRFPHVLENLGQQQGLFQGISASAPANPLGCLEGIERGFGPDRLPDELECLLPISSYWGTLQMFSASIRSIFLLCRVRALPACHFAPAFSLLFSRTGEDKQSENGRQCQYPSCSESLHSSSSMIFRGIISSGSGSEARLRSRSLDNEGP